jgi:hypothetical protein
MGRQNTNCEIHEICKNLAENKQSFQFIRVAFAEE